MSVESVDTAAVVNRVKRAQGQLAGVLRMIEDGRELETVLPQLKAVSRALDRAALAMLLSDLRRVIDGGAVEEDHLARLERFVLGLA